MTQYKAYEIRREILSFKGDEYTKALFVLLEHIDWSTGTKVATSWTHMKNWLNQLCSKYNIDMEVMKKAVQTATYRGWLDLDDNGKRLSLGSKPELNLIDEDEEEVVDWAPAPVETDDVPHYKRAGWVPLTRERIRELAECPKCGAEQGLLCKGEKKGNHNREANHKERSQAASRIAKKEFDMGNT